MSEQILVLFRKQLGDLLILQPAISLLAERHQLPVRVFCRDGMDDLLSLMPGQVSRAGKWPQRYRAVYSFDPKPGATLYAALARSREKHLLLTRRSFVRGWHRQIFDQFGFLEERQLYRGEIFYRLAGGLPENFQPPRLDSPPADWSLPSLPENYVLIHPTAAWRQKCWDPERWVAAVEPWCAGREWVITSGSAEWEVELASRLASLLGQRAHNLAGKTSLRQYISLLHGASAVLCVDGSASHIAAAFGVPSLTLFGPSNAVQWHYPGPERLSVLAADHAPGSQPVLDTLPVAPVRAALAQILGERGHG